MTTLQQRHCQPLGAEAALSPRSLKARLAQLNPGWQLTDGTIRRRFAFKDFHQTMAFVNAVAWIAHAEDHHPDLAVGYGSCTVSYSTHSAGGVTLNDFICAAKIDALLP
jgi:4a-hydroxytetrahydrobiopterin dehydratase